MAQRSFLVLLLLFLCFFAGRNGVSQEIKTFMMAAPTCASTCTAPKDAATKECCVCEPCQSDGSFDPDFGACLTAGHCPAPATGSSAPAGATRIPSGPSYPCSPLKNLGTNMWRCGDYLIWLKDAAPDYMKWMPAHEAVIKLREEARIDRELVSMMGDFKLVATPNDPMFGSDQSFLNGTAVADIGAKEAWSALTGNGSVIVAMIDSGANVGHPDLQANIWQNPGETANGADDDGNSFADDVNGFDFVDGDADLTDPVNHGTGVAGIIGAAGNNGVGIAGVNWGVNLMPLKFTDNAGKGSLTTALAAIDYAIDKGAKVINASFVMDLGAGDPVKVQTLQEAVQKAVDAGIVFVAAAGNNGLNIDGGNVYPAGLPVEPIIAVAAVDEGSALTSISNFGPESVDIAAPGQSVLTTTANGSYGGMSGTSFATPFVAGAAALLKAFNSSLTPAEIKAALVNSAKSSSNLSGKVASGGTLNVAAALASVGASVTASSPSSGTPASGTPSGSSTPVVASSEKTATSSSGKSGGGCSLVTSY